MTLYKGLFALLTVLMLQMVVPAQSAHADEIDDAIDGTETAASGVTGLPAGFTHLHVNVAKSCPIVELPGRDATGPFEKTIMCSESELKTTKFLDGKVYRIVDGDTIHLYLGKKLYAIRMLGMDTPELHYYGRAQPTWGMRAKLSLQAMVKPGDAVRAVLDQVHCDRYGRLLAHIYKGKKNLNYEQVKNGMAANYCIAPNLMFCKEFADAYQNAENQHLNIHSDACMVTPYVWRRAMQNLEMDKKVKNRLTGAVVAAPDYYKIPVADRVFYP